MPTHLLLIEDSASYAELVQIWLQVAYPALQVKHVELLALGIELLQTRPFPWAAILLDLTLPDARAVTAIPRIYEAAQVHDTPIIVLSAMPQAWLPTPLRVQYNRYVEKDGTAEGLLTALEDLLVCGPRRYLNPPLPTP